MFSTLEFGLIVKTSRSFQQWQADRKLELLIVFKSRTVFFFLDRHEVESYIKAKYVDRRFVRRPSDEELRNKVVSLSKQEKRLSSSSEHLPPRPPPPTPRLRPGSNVSGQSGW